MFSVHDDNTVRVYVDCRWLRTDVLEKDALDTPRDADLIIGYLFSVSNPETPKCYQQWELIIRISAVAFLSYLLEDTRVQYVFPKY